MPQWLPFLLAGVLPSVLQGIFGGGKSASQSTTGGNWKSPSLGMMDPYMVNAFTSHGLTHGVGSPEAWSQMQNELNKAWPQILRAYGQSQSPRSGLSQIVANRLRAPQTNG